MPCRPIARRYMRFAIMSPYSGTGNYAGAARGRTWCGSRWRNWWTNFSPSPVSFIPGRVCGLPSNTQGRSRVRESRSLGSVRGDRGNSVPYRDRPSSDNEETQMARTSPRERPDQETVLWPIQKNCPACGLPMRVRYENRRTVVTLSGTQRLCLKIRRCEQVGCAREDRPYRPEAEGAIALAQHEFGLDVIALTGVQRHRHHRSVPEIHQALRAQGVAIAERSVTNLLDRYDELLATSLTDSARLRDLLAAQGRVILALDGLQPDVGHEVLWVIRDGLSGEVLLARSLLSGTADDQPGGGRLGRCPWRHRHAAD